jgi:hypothetical protein
MPKLSIYVPDDIHADMAKFSANWSGVAQAAFVRYMQTARRLQALRAQRDAQVLGVLSDPHGGRYEDA